MLDINYIRANRQKVEDAIHNKAYEIDLDEILKLDDERKELSQKIDTLRQERNQISAKMKGGKPDKALIERGKALKSELSELESKLSEVEPEYIAKLKTVPNVPEDDVRDPVTVLHESAGHHLVECPVSVTAVVDLHVRDYDQ